MNMRVIVAGPLTIAVVLAVGLAAAADWKVSVSKDEMTGKKECYAISPTTKPTKPMGFPYAGVVAWMGVGTDADSEWVFVGFNEAPNLANTTTKDGYNLITTRIKWDDQLENVSMTQDWSAKFLHFQHDSKAIASIGQAQSVLLELNWYGNGNTYFRFPLGGSGSAISTMRTSCSGS